jgi:GNAT superfamily N-acetyltransferase
VTAIEVRPLAPGDRDPWAALWRGYLDFYRTELPEEQYDRTWSWLMTPGESPHGLGAVGPSAEGGDSALIGIVHYIFHRSCWLPTDTCYLQDLFVAEAVRGTGAGRALIEGVYAAADRAGASQVYWLTQHFNDTARRLYDRIGVPTPFIKYNRS